MHPALNFFFVALLFFCLKIRLSREQFSILFKPQLAKSEGSLPSKPTPYSALNI
jgi:hypothetical protein